MIIVTRLRDGQLRDLFTDQQPSSHPTRMRSVVRRIEVNIHAHTHTHFKQKEPLGLPTEFDYLCCMCIHPDSGRHGTTYVLQVLHAAMIEMHGTTRPYACPIHAGFRLH